MSDKQEWHNPQIWTKLWIGYPSWVFHASLNSPSQLDKEDSTHKLWTVRRINLRAGEFRELKYSPPMLKLWRLRNTRLMYNKYSLKSGLNKGHQRKGTPTRIQKMHLNLLFVILQCGTDNSKYWVTFAGHCRAAVWRKEEMDALCCVSTQH